MDTPVFSSDGKFVKMYENYVKIAILIHSYILHISTYALYHIMCTKEEF